MLNLCVLLKLVGKPFFKIESQSNAVLNDGIFIWSTNYTPRPSSAFRTSVNLPIKTRMKGRISNHKIILFHKARAVRFFILYFFIAQSYVPLARANSEAPVFYTIQNGDTLSNVLYALNLRPLYGDNGSLAIILECNKFKRSGDFIKPGDKLIFNYSIDPDLSKHVHLTADREIIISKQWLKSEKTYAPVKENNFTNLCPEALRETESKPSSSSNQSNSESNLRSNFRSKSRSFFMAEMTNAFTRQDLRTNSNGYSEILSKASPGFRLQWREELSEKWDLDLSYAQYSISQSAPQNSTLSGNSNFTEFTISGLWNFKKDTEKNGTRWGMGPLIKYQTEPIAADMIGNTIRLESPHVIAVGGHLENEIALGIDKKTFALEMISHFGTLLKPTKVIMLLQKATEHL